MPISINVQHMFKNCSKKFKISMGVSPPPNEIFTKSIKLYGV